MGQEQHSLRIAAIGVTLFGGAAIVAAADPPRFDSMFPVGGARGTTLTVELNGEFKPWPVQVWIEGDGITATATDDTGKLSVQIAEDAPLGVRRMRLVNEQGASWPRWFEVGMLPETAETEPNGSVAEAQACETLPITINGRLHDGGGDVDSYAVRLDAGQWLVAAVQAFRLGAPVDAALQVLDPHGTVLAFNQDADEFDPLLAFQAPTADIYIVRLFGFIEPARADVRFVSHPAAAYRLTLTTGPFVRYAFPAGVQRGRLAPVHLFGWNLGQTGRALVSQADASDATRATQRIFATTANAAGRATLAVGSFPEGREVEPNDAADVAFPVSIPYTMNGRIDPAGDQDRFAFRVEKGVACRFSLSSAELGFPLDAVLTIEDSAGKSLASNDDGGTRHDARLQWTAPSDGTFVVAVRDLLDGGGPEYVYRLEMMTAQHEEPSFSATVNDHTFRLTPGGSTDLTVSVTRTNRYAGTIMVVAKDLPEGVTCTSAAVPSKSGPVTLTLSADADAPAAGQSIRILCVATDDDPPVTTLATAAIKATTAAKALDIDHTDTLWLTVTPKPPAPPLDKEEKPEP